MEELVNQTVDESAPKRNRGRFQRGDTRINRAGRPPEAGPDEAPWDRAPQADRLQRLLLSARDFLFRFTTCNAPWIVNLPADTEMVACHWNAADNVVVLVLRSSTFPKIARGALLPEFEPQYNGLRWKRR